MALFRPQRGSLEDSMKEVVEIKSKKCLIDKIKKDLSDFGHNFIINKDTVTIEFYCEDVRIDWNTHIVKIENYGVFGFTNGQLN